MWNLRFGSSNWGLIRCCAPGSWSSPSFTPAGSGCRSWNAGIPHFLRLTGWDLGSHSTEVWLPQMVWDVFNWFRSPMSCKQKRLGEKLWKFDAHVSHHVSSCHTECFVLCHPPDFATLAVLVGSEAQSSISWQLQLSSWRSVGTSLLGHFCTNRLMVSPAQVLARSSEAQFTALTAHRCR